MNGYVEIKFNERSGRTYIYKLPHYISLMEVENWVVVEDAFYKKGNDQSPYKIARVVNKYKAGSTFDHIPTSYIVDIIRGKSYQKIRDVQNQIQLIDDKMTEKFDNLPTLVKVQLMRRVSDDFELIGQEQYVKDHGEL